MSPTKISSTFPQNTKYDHNILILVIFFAATAASCTIDFSYGMTLFTQGLLLLMYFNCVRFAYLLPILMLSMINMILLSVEAFCILAIHYLFFLILIWIKTIAIALMVNPTIAFALAVAVAAILIRFYKIDPEPIFLLLMHGIVSVSMLYDPVTTFAFIIVIVAAIGVFGDYDLPTERVVVFVISVTVPAIFGKVTASIACALIGVAIVLFRLRPLQPESLSLLALGSLAATLLFNKVAGTVAVFAFITAITGLFVLNKVKRSPELAPPVIETPPPPRNISSHPNGYLPLSNPTESLDLHGHTVTGAMKVLHLFLQEHEEEYRKNRARHIRYVTIITGDSGDNRNLIRPTVENFLKINRYKYELSTEVPGLVKVDLESHVL